MLISSPNFIQGMDTMSFSACCNSDVFIQDCEDGAYYICEKCLSPATLILMDLSLEKGDGTRPSSEAASFSC